MRSTHKATCIPILREISKAGKGELWYIPLCTNWIGNILKECGRTATPSSL
jgi:hypothetical protein